MEESHGGVSQCGWGNRRRQLRQRSANRGFRLAAAGSLSEVPGRLTIQACADALYFRAMETFSLYNDQQVLDKPEAAAFLRIKKRTLDEWMKKRRVPFLKLPSGAVRFRKDHLLEFISQFEINAR